VGHYYFPTRVGLFEIRQQGMMYFPTLDGCRLGTNTYIDPQFAVDDLVAEVIELSGGESAVLLGLPEDLSCWLLKDAVADSRS
jgi:hypothetical protein